MKKAPPDISNEDWLEKFLPAERPFDAMAPRFPGRPSPSEKKAEETTRVAREIIDAAMEERQAATARLRAARLKNEAEARETVKQPLGAKQARVVEEFGLRKETEVQHERIQNTVRKSQTEIEDTRTSETSRITGDSTNRDCI